MQPNIFHIVDARHQHKSGLGYGSDAINGQLVAVQTRDAWVPVAFGPTPGQAGGPAPIPTVPPVYGAMSAAYNGSPGSGVTTSGPGSSGVANTAASEAARSAPFNFKLSPLPWAIIFLVVGLLGLRFVHWR